MLLGTALHGVAVLAGEVANVGDGDPQVAELPIKSINNGTDDGVGDCGED
jgi:hypothetical protein